MTDNLFASCCKSKTGDTPDLSHTNTVSTDLKKLTCTFFLFYCSKKHYKKIFDTIKIIFLITFKFCFNNISPILPVK